MDIEHSILHSKVEYPFKVKIMPVVGDNSQWTWCCDNVPDGKWKVLLGFFTNSSETYYFLNEDDAVAFKLRFGSYALQ